MLPQDDVKLMMETLETAADYIGRLVKGIDECAGYFHTGEKKKAMDTAILIIDGLNWLVQAITLTKPVHKGGLDVSDVNDFLKEINEAFENRDYILVSDILVYEIKPGLESWSEKLTNLL